MRKSIDVQKMLREGRRTWNPKQKAEPPVENKWRKLTDTKWEFKSNGMIIATITKTGDKFSLWYKSPLIYAKVRMALNGETYQYPTIEEAKDAFIPLLKKHAEEWCKTILGLINVHKTVKAVSEAVENDGKKY